MTEMGLKKRELLLISGILASILYICTDILGGLLWGNYDYVSQFISELSAIESPSRTFVLTLYIIHNIFIIVFALGVWKSANGKRTLEITGGLLIGYAIAGVTGLFYPMYPEESVTAFPNVMHQMAIAVTVLVILLSLAIAAIPFGIRFRIFSLGIILVYLGLGALPFLGAAQAEVGESAPWVGLVERIMVYGYMLWVSIFAILLIRRTSSQVKSTTPVPFTQ